METGIVNLTCSIDEPPSGGVDDQHHLRVSHWVRRNNPKKVAMGAEAERIASFHDNAFLHRNSTEGDLVMI
jgi:hypothetical protein